MERLLKASELSRLSGVPRSSLYHLAKEGLIPHTHYGHRCVRFPEGSVQTWLEQRTEGGEAVGSGGTE